MKEPNHSHNPDEINRKHTLDDGSGIRSRSGDDSGDRDDMGVTAPFVSGEEAGRVGRGESTPSGSFVPVMQTADIDVLSPLPRSSAQGKGKSKKKVVAIVLGALVVIGLIIWVLTGLLTPPPTAPVQTTEVSKGLYEEVTDGKASLEPVHSTIASAEVEGIVEEVFVDEGSLVAEGDALYVIKNDDLDSAVIQASTALQSARNALTQAQNALSVARVTPSVNPVQDAEGNTVLVDTQATQISDAQAQVSSANATLEAAQNSYDAAVAKADKRTVRATMSGMVLERNITAGTALASLNTAGKAPMQIADISSYIVKVPISEVDISKVEVGQDVRLSFASLPDLEAVGKVTHISQVNGSSHENSAAASASTSSTVRYEVTVQIDDPDPRLKSGMTAQAKINVLSLEDVLMVSSMAVVEEDGMYFLNKAAVSEEGESEKIAIEILATSTRQTAFKPIDGEVSAGDVMVIPSDDVGGEGVSTEGMSVSAEAA